MKKFIALFLLSVSTLFGNAFAQEQHALDRNQLVQIMHAIQNGINTENFSLISEHLDKDVIITWPNAEVTKGPQGANAYLKKMVGSSPDTILRKFETKASVSDTANFYGNIAVAHGTSEDTFTPHDRAAFNFSSRWTATLLKNDAQWKIVSLHLSTNVFNNSLLDELKKYTAYAAAGGALLGFLLASFIGFILRKKMCQKK